MANHFIEAEITIGGLPLAIGQSMTLRVAISEFLMWLQDPEVKDGLGTIAEGYRARATEIQNLILASIAKQKKPT